MREKTKIEILWEAHCLEVEAGEWDKLLHWYEREKRKDESRKRREERQGMEGIRDVVSFFKNMLK